MGRARKPWSSLQPRTPGERTRETWRLRPGARNSLSSLLSSPQPPGLPRPSGHCTPSRLSPTSLRCPRGAPPPPGPSVRVVAAPFPRPFRPWVSAATSVSRLPGGGRGRARGVWVRGSVLPRGSPWGPARLRPPLPATALFPVHL